MNTLRNNNKHLQLSTLAYSAGRVCLALALAFTLSVTSGVVQAAPLAATAPGLGSASNFAVLSAAPDALGAVTCTTSTVNGDVGSSGPMTSVTQTLCTITGAVIAPVSDEVLADFNDAYDAYAAIDCTGSLDTAYTGQTLTLTPGVYCNDAAVTFTDSTLTLDGQGDANAVWIFKIGTLGTGALTGTNFSVVMAGEGDPCNVSWWVAEAATMTTSGFQGTILAGAAITVTGLAGTPTPFNGDVLAKAAVTLTDVTLTGCKGDDGGDHGCKDGKGKGKGHGQDCCDDGKGKGHGQDCCDDGRGKGHGQKCCDDGGRGKGHGQNCCDDGGRGKGHGQNCCDDGKGKGHGQNCCDDGKGKGHGQDDCKRGKGK
jgi:hypothetical protein